MGNILNKIVIIYQEYWYRKEVEQIISDFEYFDNPYYPAPEFYVWQKKIYDLVWIHHQSIPSPFLNRSPEILHNILILLWDTKIIDRRLAGKLTELCVLPIPSDFPMHDEISSIHILRYIVSGLYEEIEDNLYYWKNVVPVFNVILQHPDIQKLPSKNWNDYPELKVFADKHFILTKSSNTISLPEEIYHEILKY